MLILEIKGIQRAEGEGRGVDENTAEYFNNENGAQLS